MIESSQTFGYWNGYYRSREAPELPSQFALFVANEAATDTLGRVGAVLDVGCGNGRDSLFFAQLGYEVAGIDLSAEAIARCQERARSAGLDGARIRFLVGPADGEEVASLGIGLTGPVLIYSRFFFHAIDDDTELGVLRRLGEILKTRGGVLAAEFRSTEDAAGERETGAHYRRYIDPALFASRLADVGLELVWSAQGRGMAKYRNDDAHVARVIARPW